MKILKSYFITLTLVVSGISISAQNITKGDNLIDISFGIAYLVIPKGFTNKIPQ